MDNDGLDKYGAEPFEQQQFETAGVEGVQLNFDILSVNPGYVSALVKKRLPAGWMEQ